MKLGRREFLFASGAAALAAQSPQPTAINRRALVERHNPVLREADLRAPLSVGNGEFAFTADITGLQTLYSAYESTVPLCTQSQWGWHGFPLPYGLDPAAFRLEMFDTYGREVGYATQRKGQEQLYDWLRQNPHRLNLARIGLLLDRGAITADEITRIEQNLDLWSGTLKSQFRLRDQPVSVVTCCHPELDALAIRVETTLGTRLSVAFDFPYGSTAKNASDWSSPERYQT